MKISKKGNKMIKLIPRKFYVSNFKSEITNYCKTIITSNRNQSNNNFY